MTITHKGKFTDDPSVAARVVELRKAGRTAREIAVILGCGPSTANRLVKSCIASGLLDQAEEVARNLLRLRKKYPKRFRPRGELYRFHDWDMDGQEDVR